MTSKLAGTVAIVTGASSGIGAATARRLAMAGASVALLARRQDRLDLLVTEIEAAGGTAFSVPSDIADQTQATAAVQTVIDRFGRIDILINNAGLMLLGPIVGADVEEWERMLAINVRGLLYITHAALPHLLTAAADGPRNVADVVNISSVAGRRASALFGVYNLTKFGVNGFTESLRQEITQNHVRVGVLEPGAVATELGSHNNDRVQTEMLEPFNAQHQVLQADDIADGIEFMVTRPRHASIAELFIMPTDQVT
ncbi:SDR family NAD(P)-dependent oxidoreductase [Paracidovorax valerianellae]|uniref:NADP-dependent 3-hydroxy acid dehydrogenase YdfG n=1 Tax=Paracidovorax valerianellae TaxID=187868 RepID=A0A1G6LJF4_9BURK|nr:SDR family NAD(P)-dependent oxidoreductase [Paracidovorax valerianellae]MDA8446461.1 SDR family NAD(P)-dependent oxidoreductase [Paracidovorax valerianellae]SDC43097.1 NADP-dependent 3-hydroxy acid dehydrogenase YdfG [Paracidovorax valerianellae]